MKKVCTSCGQEEMVEMFYQGDSYCKICRMTYNRAYHAGRRSMKRRVTYQLRKLFKR